MRASINLLRVISLATLAAALAGCSEYSDRRDAISLQGGNAIQADKVVQMVDPWPRASANHNIAYNGAVMQAAVERYRTGRVIRPSSSSTSGTYQAASQNNNNTTPVGPTVVPPAAAVK